MADDVQIRWALASVRATAEQLAARDDALAAFENAVLHARRLGVSVITIADTAGRPRNGIYKILRRRGGTDQKGAQ